MNDVLKQRLVGALILVALGVVFWPIIFVEPGDAPGEERARIPPRPAVDTTPLERPDTAGLRESPETELQQHDVWGATAAESPDAPQPGEAQPGEAQPGAAQPGAAPASATSGSRASQPERTTRVEAPVQPTLDGDGVPVAWVLQVVSVSSADKADQLRDRLLAMGHKAYVKRVRQGGKSLYRVCIGPSFERASIEQIQGEIDAEFRVKSMIARYVP